MNLPLSKVPTDEQIEAAANERIDRRRATGQKLASIARQLQKAQDEVLRITTEYEKAYKEATVDAWTAKELRANGLPNPPVTRKRTKGRAPKKSEAPEQTAG